MWQLIDTAPKDGRKILLYDGEFTTFGCFNPATGHLSVELKHWFKKPTHWQPLPDPPQIEQEGK